MTLHIYKKMRVASLPQLDIGMFQDGGRYARI